MDTPNPNPQKTPRVNTGESLTIKIGEKGDLVLYKTESPPGQQPGTITSDTKLTPVLVLTGDTSLPTHPVYMLRMAISAYLETQSRGKVLGPKWAEPVTSQTPVI